MAALNANRAQRVIDFIECLKITIGKDAKKPFVLRPWQKAFIRDVYAPVRPNGFRLVRRAILSIARKNGKTELAAALILVHLIGPEAELNGEIYSAANDREQASIVFNAVVRMINASRTLQKSLKVIESRKRIVVIPGKSVQARGSKFRALAADGKRNHGLNPSFIVYDELAQSKNRELLDSLLTSQGGREEPLFLTISTQNNDPQHPLSEMIDHALKVDEDGNKQDETVICHLHASDDDCDLLDEEQWRKANPGLGDFRDYDEFKSMAERAAALPSEEQTFRLYYLNQRVSLHSSLIKQADWRAAQGEVSYAPKEPIYLGLDLSSTTDLTALVAVSANDGSRVKAWFWKPEGLITEHTKADGVRYDL